MAPALDSRIDDLYRAPLSGFVEARTALAKTLTGDEAKRVRALPKPTLVPWAVNQVYWRARTSFDRLMKSGEQLRDAQVAALEGRKADVRAATEAHRKAVADAVQEATTIAGAEGSHPAADALMRMFEALSLARDRDETPGRWTKPLQPAGFEALAGIKVSENKQAEAARQKSEVAKKEQQAAQKKADAARKKHEAEIKKAEAALERARQKMRDAEAALKDTRSR